MASEKAKLAGKKVVFLDRFHSLPFAYDDFLTNFVTGVIQKGDNDELSWLLEDVCRMAKTLKGTIGTKKERPRYNYFQPEKARNINVSLRYDILQRDGFRCKICGRNPEEDDIKLHVDHIQPFSKGGLTRPDNLRALCQDCNLGKKDKYEY